MLLATMLVVLAAGQLAGFDLFLRRSAPANPLIDSGARDHLEVATKRGHPACLLGRRTSRQMRSMFLERGRRARVVPARVIRSIRWGTYVLKQSWRTLSLILVPTLATADQTFAVGFGNACMPSRSA